MDYIEYAVAWLKQIFKDGMEFLTDLPLLIFQKFLDGLAHVIELIPVPDFMALGIQPFFDPLPDSIVFFVIKFQVPGALAIVGAGVAFRLLRKFVTLFQW